MNFEPAGSTTRLTTRLDDRGSVDLRQFLGILLARWRFIAVIVGLGITATVGLVLATPQTYASQATLFISTPSTGVLDPYQATLTAQQRAQSYANLAKDTEVLQAAAERLNAGLSARQLSHQVETSVVKDTLLLRVDARASSPVLAQQIATVMSDEIIRLVKNLETPSDSEIPAPIIARVAGKASLNQHAVAPNVPLDLMTGLALSILAGLAGALIRNVLDTSVRTSEDVEQITGNALIGTLPFDANVREHPLSSDDASGSLAEAFRVLRTNLQFADLDATRQSRQMLLVTSALPDEGKTFVATNLAIALAKGGRSVLLLDADMRNPQMADLLGLENSVGMITVLLGRATLEQATQEHSSGVRFLATGPQPPNPAEVLDTQSMRDFLLQLRNMYEVVIVDAPPLLPVADAAILLTEVDGALLLARYGTTGREQLRQAVARIQAVGGRLFGTILNRTPRRTAGKYGYGYEYGYGGYGYGTDAKQSSSRRGRKAAERNADGAGRRARR